MTSHQGLLAAVEAASTGVVITDTTLPDDPIIYMNPAFEQLTGYTAAETIGRNCRFLQGPETDKVTLATMRKAIDDGQQITCRLLNYRKDGSTFWNALTINPIHGEDEGLLGFVGIQSDVTAEVAMRQELDEKIEALEEVRGSLEAANSSLRMIAYIDSVTGLPTRRLFDDRLKQALARSRRSGDMIAIIFMDLDGFKQVNDAFGHDVGDSTLRAAGQRMRDQIRESDTLARLGGDEYAVLLDTGVTPEVLMKVCGRIEQTFSLPFDVGGTMIGLGVSIGVALYPRDGEDAHNLLRVADAAMYEAKNNKPGGPLSEVLSARVRAG
ncbi:diguanylate cyclase [Pelagibius litoralis]|uniref:Diguanylate cyclase n=1 Tax=Pelagibius litoralis TaxID=374515 RepID=A0A967F0G9_9PROT|nr:GGDEF domain-containing protein [Pelagibius litoralis]NIA70820.1 diguanylate cyclase [Pelagibius litoralis]